MVVHLHGSACEVRRSIPLLPVSAPTKEAAAKKLGAIEPIAELRFEGDSRLHLRYDASCVGFGEIECLLDEAGLVMTLGSASALFFKKPIYAENHLAGLPPW